MQAMNLDVVDSMALAPAPSVSAPMAPWLIAVIAALGCIVLVLVVVVAVMATLSNKEKKEADELRKWAEQSGTQPAMAAPDSLPCAVIVMSSFKLSFT